MYTTIQGKYTKTIPYASWLSNVKKTRGQCRAIKTRHRVGGGLWMTTTKGGSNLYGKNGMFFGSGVLKGTERLGGWLWLVVGCWLLVVVGCGGGGGGGGGNCRRCDLFVVHGRFICLVLILVDYYWPRMLGWWFILISKYTVCLSPARYR